MRLKQCFVWIALLFIFSMTQAMAQKHVVGKASYYGSKFHGRLTSDGSVYHRDSLTCAHRTLPFGTLLKVRNVKNGREVIVKVNDRGPFVKGRIIDLSFAAAKKIGMLSTGVARVEVKKVGRAGIGYMLPELQLPDPMTGEFFTVSEWTQRSAGQGGKDVAQDKKNPHSDIWAKYKDEPRWQIFNTKTSAKVESRKERSKRM